MKLTGTTGDTLEVDIPSQDLGDDVLLVVSVCFHGFSGTTEVWVLKAAWGAFLSALTELERTRRGEASLEGISPEELRLKFRSLDHAGHMGVEGFIGMRGAHTVKLDFSLIEFDPTELPRVERELRTLREPGTS